MRTIGAKIHQPDALHGLEGETPGALPSPKRKLKTYSVQERIKDGHS